MGTNASGNPIIYAVVIAIVACIILFAIGRYLRAQGHLRSRGAAFGWALLTIAPLFGSAVWMFTDHLIGRETGETYPGMAQEQAPR